MDSIIIPDCSDTLIYDIFQVEKDEENKSKEFASQESSISIFGKNNKFKIGRPFYKKVGIDNNYLSDSSKQIAEQNDIYIISSSCSFLPEDKCKFERALLKIKLLSFDINNKPTEMEPIILDIFPERVEYQTTLNYNLNINPDLKIKSGENEANFKLFELSSEKEKINYLTQIISYGYRTSEVVWQFNDTGRNELIGDVKDLLIIVATPKNSILKAIYDIKAHVRADNNIIKISKKKDMSIEYIFNEKQVDLYV